LDARRASIRACNSVDLRKGGRLPKGIITG
jgi:hypothetical protein